MDQLGEPGAGDVWHSLVAQVRGGIGLIPQSRNPWWLWAECKDTILDSAERSKIPGCGSCVGPGRQEWDKVCCQSPSGAAWSTASWDGVGWLCCLVTLHHSCFYFPKGLGSPKNRSTNKTWGGEAVPQSSTLESAVPARAGADATEMWSWQDAPAGPGGDRLGANILTGSAVGSQSIVPQTLPLTVNGYFGFLSQGGGELLDSKSLAAGFSMEKHSNTVFQRSEVSVAHPKSYGGCSPSQPNRIPGNPVKQSWMSYTPASPHTSLSFNSWPSFPSVLCPLVLEGSSSGINQDGSQVVGLSRGGWRGSAAALLPFFSRR